MAEEIPERRTILPPSSNMQYVVAVVVMVFFGVAAITAIAIMRPERDNAVLYGIIGGFIGPTLLSLLAFMKSQETHLSVNSRLDAFMGTAKIAARAEGLEEGRREGREMADRRTDELAAATAGSPLVHSGGATPGSIKVVEAPVTVIPPKL